MNPQAGWSEACPCAARLNLVQFLRPDAKALLDEWHERAMLQHLDFIRGREVDRPVAVHTLKSSHDSFRGWDVPTRLSYWMLVLLVALA
jgi:hypothetical protein